MQTGAKTCCEVLFYSQEAALWNKNILWELHRAVRQEGTEAVRCRQNAFYGENTKGEEIKWQEGIKLIII